MSAGNSYFDQRGYAMTRIDDKTLEAFVSVALKAQTADSLNTAEAALIVHGAHAIGAELQQRRLQAAMIRDLAGDVVQLFPAEAAE